MMTPRIRYELTLVDAAPAGEPPPEVRLRRLLKTALRRDGFRCAHLAEVAPATDDTAAQIHDQGSEQS